MPRRSGGSRGYGPEAVQRFLLDALKRLRTVVGATFTRTDVRGAIAEAAAPYGAEPADVQALEHVFMRAVAPHPTGHRGMYTLPAHAELALRHRGMRMPTGRLDVAAVLQLAELLDEATGQGRPLAPKLHDLHKRLRAARATMQAHSKAVGDG